MARLTKKDLKLILKECLREILLEEGIIGEQKNNIVARQNSYNYNNNNNNLPVQSQQNLAKKALLENVNMLANATGEKSSMYADILADTAMTTLQAQNQLEPRGRSMPVVQEFYSEEQADQDAQSIHQLTEQFSSVGDMSHWARLAFAKKE